MLTLTDFITVVEGDEFKIVWGRNFEKSYLDLRNQYGDVLDKKYQQFVDFKSQNIGQPCGKRDTALSVDKNFSVGGWWHFHLAPDALMIYRRSGPKELTLALVVRHEDIRNKNAAVTASKLLEGTLDNPSDSTDAQELSRTYYRKNDITVEVIKAGAARGEEFQAWAISDDKRVWYSWTRNKGWFYRTDVNEMKMKSGLPAPETIRRYGSTAEQWKTARWK